MLFKETVAVFVRIIWNTQIHYAGRMPEFSNGEGGDIYNYHYAIKINLESEEEQDED
jgi:hypothetical protein